MKKVFSNEAKIGLVTIIGLVLLYMGINYLKGINLLKPTNSYYVTFTNIKDVTVSSPVYVDGYKVGLVRSISYDYSTTGKITVEINLDEAMRVNKGSYVTIYSTFLSGAELYLNLNKNENSYLKPGAKIEGRLAKDMVSQVQSDILPQVEVMLPKIDSILTGLQTLVNDPSLKEALNHINQTSSGLEASTKQLNRLLNNDVPVIVGNLKTTSGNLSEMSGNLKDLDLATTINKVNNTLDNLKMTSDKLNSTDNSMGLLLNDKQLYNNLNGVTENANKLLIDVKENPKRYVHFSVFGKK
jgi:phospholipid/cholesterol/gamma-HCH transport system substrate-binding protein